MASGEAGAVQTRRGLDDLEGNDAVLFDAGNSRQCSVIGVQHGGKAAEFCQKLLGQRFDIALGDRQEQDQFEQFLIGHRLGAAGEKTLFATLAVAKMMRVLRIVTRHPALRYYRAADASLSATG